MAEANANSRLEAFCDGVFGIALTLLIIDVRLPTTTGIASNADLWHALANMGPTVFAFVLSFLIILITWVNHHGTLKLVDKSTGSFIYANGFLLLTVVFFPFPTALLGEFLPTGHAAQAVVLYNALTVAQAIGWILIGHTALRNKLTKDEHSASLMRVNVRNGIFAVGFYTILSILAIWFPIAIAVITTLTWIFWMVLGIRMKHG